MKKVLYGGTNVDLSIILMVIGIICILLSFFLKDSSKRVEKDLEELSISIYQETNAIKKRLKVVEEELFLEPNFTVKSPVASQQPKAPKSPVSNTNHINTKQINEILVSQVIQLNRQGYPIEEISKMSTLTKEQVISILNNGGN